MLIRLRKALTRLWEQVARFLFGYDIFISYSRQDGGKYAAALANELSKGNFHCFLDQWGASPDTRLSKPVLRALDRTHVLVVVATPGAVDPSSFVHKEIEKFSASRWRRSHRPLLPISIGGALKDAPWAGIVGSMVCGAAPPQGRALNDTPWAGIVGLYRVPEVKHAVDSPDAVQAGEPAKTVVELIVNSCKFTRRNERVRNGVILSVALFGLLFAGAYIAVLKASDAIQEAKSARNDKEKAEDEVKRARGEVTELKTEQGNLQGHITKLKTEVSNLEADKIKANEDKDRALEGKRAAEGKMREALSKESQAKDRAKKAEAEATRAESRATEAETQATQAKGELSAAQISLSDEKLERAYAKEEQKKAEEAREAISALTGSEKELADSEKSAEGDLAKSASAVVRGVSNLQDKYKIFATEIETLRNQALPASLAVRHFTVGSQAGAEVIKLLSFRKDNELVSVSKDGTVGRHNLTSGGSNIKSPRQRGVVSTAIDPGGEMLAVSFQPEGEKRRSEVQIAMLNSQNPTLLKPIRHRHKVEALAFSPQGALASGTSSGSYRVDGRRFMNFWDRLGALVRGKEVIPPAGFAFTSDGKRLAIVRQGRNTKIVEWRTKKTLCELDDEADRTMAAAFSQDGRYLVTGGRSSVVKVWEVPPESCKKSTKVQFFKELRGHEYAVVGLAFSPDHKWLATVGHDFRTVLWDFDAAIKGTETRPYLMLPRHPKEVNAVAFSRCGNLLATGDAGGTIRLWDVSPSRLKRLGDLNSEMGEMERAIKTRLDTSGRLKNLLEDTQRFVDTKPRASATAGQRE